jgi:hypothetical protein
MKPLLRLRVVPVGLLFLVLGLPISNPASSQQVGPGSSGHGLQPERVSTATDGVWSQLMPTGTPPTARYAHTAIYDPVRERMVVFGGFSSTNNCNDVWTLSLAGTPRWARLTPSGTPPSERYAHTAVYDPARDRMVVFGGRSNNYCNDVWALGLAGTPTWTHLTPSGSPPAARYYHMAIYDPLRDRMLVFGGAYTVGLSVIPLNDLWTLSLAGTPTWTALTPNGTPPSARVGEGAVYDPVGDRMLVFGGVGAGRTTFNDTWALSLSGAMAWTALTPSGTPPSARANFGAVYDPLRGRLVVLAGEDTSTHYNDVWALAMTDSPAWMALTPDGLPPSVRACQSTVYDPVGDRIVVFGGRFIDEMAIHYYNDVWALTPGDLPVDVLASLVSADATPEGIRLEWALGNGAGTSAVVYRCTVSSPWQPLGTVGPDGLGHVRWQDMAVTSGTRYGYRLRIRENFAGETWVQVPAATSFALSGARPNPVEGKGVWVHCALASAEPAALELYDVSGRRVVEREVGSLGAGQHTLDLGAGQHLAPGLYLIRLTQGANTRTTRVAVLR